MIDPIEIQPLLILNLDEILPVVSGYESNEKYAIEKSESEAHILFDIRLVTLTNPHKDSFVDDFKPEYCHRYTEYLLQGYSYGAYVQRRLVGIAISEAIAWNNSLRIWEFHVKEDFHRQGIGRALMTSVIEKARQNHIRVAYLETQNTNVSAIRFYRAMGFSLDALDLSFYTNHDVEDGEVAFFMKQKLE